MFISKIGYVGTRDIEQLELTIYRSNNEILIDSTGRHYDADDSEIWVGLNEDGSNIRWLLNKGFINKTDYEYAIANDVDTLLFY